MKLTPEERRILKAIEDGADHYEFPNAIRSKDQLITFLFNLIRKLVKRKAGR